MSKKTSFNKILVANRGEVAVRVMRTARHLGYRTVAVFSDADKRSKHVSKADEAVWIGGSAPSASYLNIPRIIEAAKRSGADAIHPGYGFLAENAQFASACLEAGLVFIGPRPETIEGMGNKAAAKQIMLAAGVPCIPGYQAEEQNEARLIEEAAKVGFPVMIKATLGGGGRGIRWVDKPDEFLHALRSAKSEAGSSFGDDHVILEKAIESPRHIEIQVMADRHGNIVHLGERDCSVQRRHQKLIEESPSPAIDSELRERMGESAIRAARAINYEGAGTVEFLLDGTGSYYFMEMNTRLQVEHPVTEAVTGLDLVELQLRVAAGEELPVQQQDVHITGHSIEVRLCCEDSQNGFMPQSGSLSLWRAPSGVRVEHALESGSTVPAQYDSMIAKLISVGKDRAEALRRLTLALDELVALGLKTNQVFLARCLHHPVFTAGDATTSFIESESEELLTRDQELGRKACAIAALLLQTSSAKPGSIQAGDAVLSHHFPISARLEFEDEVMEATLVRSESSASYTVTVDDQSMQLAVMTRGESDVMISCDGLCEKVVFTFSDGDLVLQVGGDSYRVRDQSLLPVLRKSADADGNVKASMTGRVVALHVAVGDEVTVGQPIVTLEAMKMEHTHNAPVAGRIEALAVKENQQVSVHQVIAQIKVEKEITDDVVVESQVVGAS